MTKSLNLFQFKITLHGSKPTIWREIIVPANYTFFDLHVAIQDAFGWTDSHLHQYFIGSPFKSSSRNKNIAWPNPEMDDVIDESKAIIDEYFKTIGETMYYEYDFGDSWMAISPNS